MSSKLQLDVCDNNQWWRHMVTTYEVEANIVLGKTMWSMKAYEVSRLGAIYRPRSLYLYLLICAISIMTWTILSDLMTF